MLLRVRPGKCHNSRERQCFWRPDFCRAFHAAMCTSGAFSGGRSGLVCREAERVQRGWEKSDQRQHIEHVSGCEGRPRRGRVGGWRGGEGRGGGNGDGRRAAAFIPWKANPSRLFTPLHQIKRAVCCSGALAFIYLVSLSLFSTLQL